MIGIKYFLSFYNVQKKVATTKFVIEKIDNHREALSKRNKNKTSAGEKIKS
jgi:hypothetical protein